jgi:hypothetical protein
VCHATSEQIRFAGAYVHDRALDLRSEPLYGTLRHAVHRCPSCGYCAADLSEAPPEAASIVTGSEYQEMLKAESDEPTATRFRCQALISAAAGDDVETGWAHLHAAWAYDDRKRNDQAATSRLAAVEAFRRAKARGVEGFDGSDASESIFIADLLRRAGAFEEAAAELADAPDTAEPFVVDGLAFEVALVAAQDVAAHWMSEVDLWRKRSDRPPTRRRWWRKSRA